MLLSLLRAKKRTDSEPIVVLVGSKKRMMKNAREDKDDRPAKQRVAQNLDEAAPRLTASNSQSVGFLNWTAFTYR